MRTDRSPAPHTRYEGTNANGDDPRTSAMIDELLALDSRRMTDAEADYLCEARDWRSSYTDAHRSRIGIIYDRRITQGRAPPSRKGP